MVAEELRDEDDEDEEDDEEEEVAASKPSSSSGKKRKADSDSVKNDEDKSRPKSFSQVNTSLPNKELLAKFPKFPEAQKKSITVTVKAGQMLYIPCGWFHEVHSKGEDGHMAFNYWFHTPDQKNFDQPYSSTFWKEINEKRRVHKL